jgi:signal transduction histidine kinase
VINKKNQENTIEKITLAPLVWVWILSFLTILILSCALIIKETMNNMRIAEQKLKSISPYIARAVSGELLLDNQGNVEIVVSQLKQHYELEKITISELKDSCNLKTSLLIFGIKSTPICYNSEIPHSYPKKYIAIYKQNSNFGVHIAITIFLFSVLPLLLLSFITYFILRRSLYNKIIYPISNIKYQVINEITKFLDSSESTNIVKPNLNVAIEIEEFIETLYSSAIQLKTSMREKHEIELSSRTNAVIAGLIQMLAHDIRKPLFMTKHILKLVVENINDTEKVKDLASMGLQEVSRTTTSVEGILTNVIYSNSSSLPSKESINLIEFLQQTIKSTIMMYPNTTLEIEYHFNYKGPVLIDKIKMIQVINNLIGNIAQIVEGNQKIWVNTYAANEEGMLLLKITNSGSFIPKQDLSKLFDPNYSKRKGGTGLGLFIVAKIIHEHGGRIWAESSDNKVSFLFTLPS